MGAWQWESPHSLFSERPRLESWCETDTFIRWNTPRTSLLWKENSSEKLRHPCVDVLNEIPGSVFWNCWYFMLTSVHLHRHTHTRPPGNSFCTPPTAGSPTTHTTKRWFFCASHLTIKLVIWKKKKFSLMVVMKKHAPWSLLLGKVSWERSHPHHWFHWLTADNWTLEHTVKISEPRILVLIRSFAAPFWRIRDNHPVSRPTWQFKPTAAPLACTKCAN